ncbi:ATPases of the AAA+ class [Hypoxylon sp. FL0890]|nr:ATPases of the AAA+ class [Hypoxylon sp. FL0890]
MDQLSANKQRHARAKVLGSKLSKIKHHLDSILSEIDGEPQLLEELKSALSKPGSKTSTTLFAAILESQQLEDFRRLSFLSTTVPYSESQSQLSPDPTGRPKSTSAGPNRRVDGEGIKPPYGQSNETLAATLELTMLYQALRMSERQQVGPLDSDDNEDGYEVTLATLFKETPPPCLFDSLFEDDVIYELTIPKLFEEKPVDIRNFPSPWASKSSRAKENWEHLKATYYVVSKHMDSIMEMVGLEEVKLRLVEIAFRFAVVAVRQNADATPPELSMIFSGNPGTGKTTVARHYAQFLQQSITSLDTSTSRLRSNPWGSGGGGNSSSLFGPHFQPYEQPNHAAGREVIVIELTNDGSVYQHIQMMEKRQGKATFVISGTEKEIDKFFAAKPNLRNNIPVINFPDFTEDHLYQLLIQELYSKFGNQVRIRGSWINGLPTRILIKRISKARGTANYGNIQLVRDTLISILHRQSARLLEESKIRNDIDLFLLTPEDLIGPPPSTALEHYEAWQKLQAMVGLKSVKAAVRSQFLQFQWNYDRELKELPPVKSSLLNRLFLGNPGTGKTTVAKLYAQILADAGLLSSSEVMVRTAADFIGQYIGQSETKTKAILNAARGKVLVIDEAYMLGNAGNHNKPDSFRTAVIDTLVGEIQSGDNEDRCVLLLGYRQQMEEMFRNTNPGLARRFPISSAFEFEDYTNEELFEILELKLVQRGLKATDEAKEVAMEILERARNSTTFGNAGEVDNLLGRAKERQNKRLANVETLDAESMETLEAQDMDEDFDRVDRAAADVRKLFSGMIGSEALVKRLEGWQRIVKNVRRLDLGDPRDHIPFNFLFRGPPGTGKTTTARKMGKVFYDLGFLATTEIVECSASDLIGEYMGQTGPKTRKVFEKALGKVLFIDEAYRLSSNSNSHSFASEAVGEMVDILTQEKFRNKLVVILAGYEEDINRLLACNPGLSSRFPETINFENLTPAHCRELLLKSIKLDVVVDETAYGFIEAAFKQLASLPYWGNARDVQTLAKNITSVALMDDEPMLVEELLIMCEMDKMLRERHNRATHM